jgi:hypothetical protein
VGKAVFGRAGIGALLDALGPAPDRTWVRKGRCFNDFRLGEDFFFPKREDSEEMERAVNYCQACSVRPQCLQYAIDVVDKGKSNKAVSGVYGGTTPQQRVELRRKVTK